MRRGSPGGRGSATATPPTRPSTSCARPMPRAGSCGCQPTVAVAARLGAAELLGTDGARRSSTPRTWSARSTCAARRTARATTPTTSKCPVPDLRRALRARARCGPDRILADRRDRCTGVVLVLRDVHRQTAVLRALATLSRVDEAMVPRRRTRTSCWQSVCAAVVETGRLSRWSGSADRSATPTAAVVPCAAADRQVGYLDEVAFSWGEGEPAADRRGWQCGPEPRRSATTSAADPAYEPWLAAAAAYGFTCKVALPVRVDGAVEGVLGVYAEEPGSFDDLALSLLEDLAADLGFGLTRLREADRLQDAPARGRARPIGCAPTLDSLLDPFVLLESVRDDAGRLVDLHVRRRQTTPPSPTTGSLASKLIGSTMLELFPALFSDGPLAAYFAAIETGEPMILDDVPVRERDARGDPLLRPARGPERRRAGADLARRHRPAPRSAGGRRLSRADFQLLAGERVGLRRCGRRPGGGDRPGRRRRSPAPSGSRSRSSLGRTASWLVHPDHLPVTVRANDRAGAGSRRCTTARCCSARTGRTAGTSSPSARCSTPTGAVAIARQAWRDVDAEVRAEDPA